MGISLKPRLLKRYKDIAHLLLKYGRSDLVASAGLEEVLAEEQPGSTTAETDAKQLADDLEAMGPTFIKLGQLLSTRGDLIPEAYIEALERLQDSVDPFPYEEVEEIVCSELGVRLTKAFAHFDPEPLAAASLGQVHRATLRDGRPVAVKVQRPDIRRHIADDLEALEDIAEFLDSHTEAGRRYGFGDILEQFRRSLLRELDYRAEAQNLSTLAENLADYELIVVPRPIDDYTTSRVLTMEFVPGRKITSIGPLAHMELNGPALADALFQAYLQQMLVDGFFHADPHPGNVFITDDGRLALLDLGMAARVGPAMQDNLVRLVLALADGRGEDAAYACIRMGEKLDAFDETEFVRAVSDLVTRHQHSNLAGLDAGAVAVEMSKVAGECGLRPPPELALIGKALLNLDQVARVLDPDFNPDEAMRRHALAVLRSRLTRATSQGNVFSTLLDAKEFVEKLPGRVNRLMDSVAAGDFTVKVDAIDERELMRGVQKLANRVTMGLVIAALVIGAAMLMRIETQSKLFGYPSLAIVCFLGAALAAFALLGSIVWNDRDGRRRR